MNTRGQFSLDYFLMQVFLFSVLVGLISFAVASNAFNKEVQDSSVINDFISEIESFSVDAFSRSVGDRVSFEYSIDVDFNNVEKFAEENNTLYFSSPVFEGTNFPAFFSFPVFFHSFEDGLTSNQKTVFFETFIDGNNDKFLFITFDDICPNAPLISTRVYTTEFINYCGCENSSRPSSFSDYSDFESWYNNESNTVNSCVNYDFNGDCKVNADDLSALREYFSTSDEESC